MKNIISKSFIFLFLCAVALNTAAQSFDLRPQSTKPKKVNEYLMSFLDNNDVDGMRKYLSKNKDEVNSNSRIFKSSNGAKQGMPLLHDAISRALHNTNNNSVEMCQVIINAGCDLHPVFDGKTPIYVLMEFIATHKKSECENAVKILHLFDSRSDWDANLRYRSELPPLNYLINCNYEFLGKKFSKEYIADEVMEILFRHGASVTSYNQKGGTLMDFALDTENDSLQSYLLEKGVNLRHEDKQGEDAVFKLIANGRINQIREAIEQGKISIDINTLKNEPSTFSNNKELYDYLAAICANNASSYEDIILYRKRFSDKKDLIQQKYENLAKSEVNVCTNYNMIANCMKRYPDLASITGPKMLIIAEDELKAIKTIDDIKTFELHYPDLKEKALGQKEIIYKADCIALQEAYNQMKISLQNQSMDINSSISSKFVENYGNYYDPQQQLTLAHAMNAYANALNIVQKKFGPYYTSTNSFDHQYNLDMSQLNKALSDCNDIQKYELSSDWLTKMIISQKNALTNHYNECNKAVKMVDAITENSIPKPSRQYTSKNDYHYYWKDFSFIVTDYSSENDKHYVVHGMKGGKLSKNFIKGYGSLKGAVIAGWAAAEYGFARTQDPPIWTGGLLSAIILQKIGSKRELDLYQARESDEIIGLIFGD